MGKVGLLVGTDPRCQSQGRAYHNVDAQSLYGDRAQIHGKQGQVWRSHLQLQAWGLI